MAKALLTTWHFQSSKKRCTVGAQMPPKMAQDGSKLGPRQPKGDLRWPKRLPSLLQDEPRLPQDASKNGSRCSQRWPGRCWWPGVFRAPQHARLRVPTCLQKWPRMGPSCVQDGPLVNHDGLRCFQADSKMAQFWPTGAIVIQRIDLMSSQGPPSSFLEDSPC